MEDNSQHLPIEHPPIVARGRRDPLNREFRR